MVVSITENLLSNIKKYEDNSAIYEEIIKKRSNEKNDSANPYISIIMPCYNVQDYIDRCMETIVSQTIGVDKLQVIAVNDASTDNTFDRLISWEKKYPENIVVISYDENIRQGGARNIGLCYADAEYIGFVDSDDWIEFNMYETLYNIILEKKADAVKCKCVHDYEYNRPVNPDTAAFFDLISYNFEKVNCFYKEDIPNYGKRGVQGGIWTGLYLKEIILKNNIWFPEKLTYEDNFWSAVLSLYIKNIYIVDNVLYHYFQNYNSTVNSRNTITHLDRLYIEILIIDEYKKRGAYDTFYNQLENRFIKMFYLNTIYIIFTRFDYIPDIFNYLREKVFFYFPNFINEIDVSQYHELDQKMLKLLFIQGDIYPEMLASIKDAYLKVVGLQFVIKTGC